MGILLKSTMNDGPENSGPKLQLRHNTGHICESCGIRYASDFALKQHIEKYTETGHYQCPKCEQQFGKDDLEEHLTTHFEDNCPPCKNCGKTFTHILSLHIHQTLQCANASVKVEGYLTCKDKVVRCTKCPNAYTKESSLRAHMKKCAQDADYSCSICKKPFRKLFFLKKHELEHIQPTNKPKKIKLDTKPFLCTICAKTLDRQDYLDKHMKKHKKRPYHCSECDNYFKTPEKLKSHARCNPMFHICEKCDKEFSQPSALKAHMEMHDGRVLFPCPHCDKASTRQSSLQEHIRIHTGEKPFKCEACSRSFRTQAQLGQHKPTHMKSLSCDSCDKVFKSSPALRTHKRVHEGREVYPCPQCDSQLKSSKGLRVHLRIHTGEKSFSCDLCDESFMTSNQSIKHKRLNHTKPSFKCQTCQTSFELYSQLCHHKSEESCEPFKLEAKRIKTSIEFEKEDNTEEKLHKADKEKSVETAKEPADVLKKELLRLAEIKAMEEVLNNLKSSLVTEDKESVKISENIVVANGEVVPEVAAFVEVEETELGPEDAITNTLRSIKNPVTKNNKKEEVVSKVVEMQKDVELMEGRTQNLVAASHFENRVINQL